MSSPSHFTLSTAKGILVLLIIHYVYGQQRWSTQEKVIFFKDLVAVMGSEVKF